MNFSNIFIHRPIATSLLMLAIFFGGILSYKILPVSSLPQTDYPTIQVASYYPGAGPEIMASSVTAPLERQFSQLPGLIQMNSNSSSGSSIIVLQFTLDLDLDVAEQQVQAAINAARNFLPQDLPSPPIYSKVNPADAPILTLALTSDVAKLSDIYDFAETKLVQKISQMSGVGQVSISGGNRPAVRIKVNPELLASYGISTSEVRNAINNANVNGAKGSFDGENLAYTINANDRISNPEDYADIVITYKNNAIIKLKDIAQITSDVENNRKAAWASVKKDNKIYPAIIVNIQRQPSANSIEVASQVKAALTKLTASIPQKINISIISDRTINIQAAIKDIKFELLLSVFFVVIIIFIFLRNLSITIIPAISIPVSLIGTFGVMLFLGFSINNLTLMALTIAAGFVVDDAIVMVENITRYIEKGEKPFEASIKGARQIGFTIISLSVSLIAVLIPLLFMDDIAGRLFHEFALSLTITILISAFVSLSLTPMLCAKIINKKNLHKESDFIKSLDKIITKSIKLYGKSLKVILKNQNLTLFFSIFTLFATIILFYFVPKGFFPRQDTGIVQAFIIAPQNIGFANMKKLQEDVNNLIYKEKEVESISSFIGVDGTNVTLNSSRMLIKLHDKTNIWQFIAKIKEQTSNDSRFKIYLQSVEDLEIDSIITPGKYQYSLSTRDREDLGYWSDIILNKLNKIDKITNVNSNLQNKGLQIYIKVNRERASNLGIDMQNISNSLYDLFGQRQISTIFTENNQYHVIIEASNIDIDNFSNIYLKSSNGLMIPLNNIATFEKKYSPLVISRQNQFPSLNLSFDLTNKASLGSVITQINGAMSDLNLPQYMQAGFEGTAKAFTSSINNQFLLIIAAIIVVYIVLGILYESYIHPLTILSTLPSACIGALLALILCNKNFDIIALIGIILLIGIVMKNAIMMIDFAIEEQRINNKKPNEAIYNACILRFRPIVMTSLAAIFGALPFVFTTGIGAEIRQPLGIVIIGGLMVSQLLTLYTTPVIYLAFEKLYDKFKN